MGPSTAGQRHRRFFGWQIVAASSLAYCLAFGFIYSFGVFAGPIARTIGYDVEGVTALFSIGYTIFQLAGFAAGWLVDRIQPRLMVTAGGLLLGGGLIAASRSTTNIQISLAFGVGVGIGLACIYVPAIGVVGDWFIRNRTYATGITVAAMGLGNLLLPPLAELLIDRYGIRTTLFLFGVMMIVIIPVAAQFLVATPEALGQYPDGDLEPPAHLAEAEGGETVRQALRSRRFWLLYASIFFASFAIFLPYTHLQKYATLHGASADVGALLVSTLGLGMIVGRLGLGRYTDRIAPRKLIVVAGGLLVLSMLFWLNTTAPALLAIFALIFGFSYATNSALQPALVLDYFGERHGDALIGLLFTAAAPGTLLGPTLAGQFFDSTGSYGLPIAAGTLVCALALACLLFLPDTTL
jgi:MFS family permease